MLKLVSFFTFLLVLISASVHGAYPEPRIQAVPVPGKIKVNSANSVPNDTSLIKTEKTLVDKNCRLIFGKMKCASKERTIIRKTIQQY